MPMPMPMLRRVLATALVVAGSAAVSASPAEAAATSPPNFQLPFRCSESWTGDANGSSAHVGKQYQIDFNRGSGSDDLGSPVVAAAAGKVVIAAHQGSTNRYGRLVKIDHGGGWYTYYAHLRSFDVREGQTVRQGQQIGTLGDSTAPGNDISPHLHYEVRYGSNATYPDNIQRATFDGKAFGYPDATVKSRNCGTDPVALCGTGFTVIDRHYLDSGSTHHGTVYLLWRGSTKENCVVTGKHRGVGTASTMRAALAPQGGRTVSDEGSFRYYAGPVKAVAPGCVVWSGATGGLSYKSPSEHCS